MATGRLPDPNSSPLTAKGDLYTYSTVPAKLAVGNNGETLVADSSATTGLRWQGDYAAGKNKIINADFRINQRAFTSTTTDGTFTFDRWILKTLGTGGTTTCSAQTFTLGTAPVAGYEGSNFVRLVTSGFTGTNTLVQYEQRIEDVRTFANQTVTVSFWAKANSGTPNIMPYFAQDFGSGGSPSGQVFATPSGGVQAISTSWARYSFVVSIPSISGKTLGTTANTSSLQMRIVVASGSDYGAPYSSIGVQNNTFEIWGVQVEAGNVATAFQTATGTLAGELAACQRYYSTSTTNGTHSLSTTQVISAPQVDLLQGFRFPVAMRSAPTVTIFSRNNTSGKVSKTTDGTDISGTATAANIGNNQVWGLSTSGLTAGTAGYEMSFTASAEL